MEETNKTNPPQPSRDERVGILAYEIWESEGRPDGKAEVHWHLACNIIDATDAGLEPQDLPPWLSKVELTPAEMDSKRHEKVVHHPRHKSAA